MFFKRTKRRIRRAIIGAIISAIAACGGGAASSWMPNFNIHAADLSQIPDYTGSPYAVLNGNEPEFDDDFTTEAFEDYSELDDLGRCGVAYANICQELMPTEKRGDIGMVKPSGWHTVKYPDIIKDRYLYNRCHLIGYQLAGENANVKNLITGTRYLNVEGMLPFENEVSDYVKDTGNHVLYRVTPIFECNNLVASGVQIEAESVEDDGAGVKFNACIVTMYSLESGLIMKLVTAGLTPEMQWQVILMRLQKLQILAPKQQMVCRQSWRNISSTQIPENSTNRNVTVWQK